MMKPLFTRDINHGLSRSHRISIILRQLKVFSSWSPSSSTPSKSVSLLPSFRMSKRFRSICFLIDEMYQSCLSGCHENSINIEKCFFLRLLGWMWQRRRWLVECTSDVTNPSQFEKAQPAVRERTLCETSWILSEPPTTSLTANRRCFSFNLPRKLETMCLWQQRRKCCNKFMQ